MEIMKTIKTEKSYNYGINNTIPVSVSTIDVYYIDEVRCSKEHYNSINDIEDDKRIPEVTC